VSSIRFVDRLRSRSGAIVQSLSPLLDDVEVLDPDDVRFDGHDSSIAPSIAVVGLSALDDAEFDVVRLLGRRGTEIIVYADECPAPRRARAACAAPTG
jgi:hypothetical protein